MDQAKKVVSLIKEDVVETMHPDSRGDRYLTMAAELGYLKAILIDYLQNGDMPIVESKIKLVI